VSTRPLPSSPFPDVCVISPHRFHLGMFVHYDYTRLRERQPWTRNYSKACSQRTDDAATTSCLEMATKVPADGHENGPLMGLERPKHEASSDPADHNRADRGKRRHRPPRPQTAPAPPVWEPAPEAMTMGRALAAKDR